MNLEDSIPVNDSTLFNVISIGKSLTSACVMQLWDKQLLGLDQNINNFYPQPHLGHPAYPGVSLRRKDSLGP